ncbi:ArsR/SmtB family transcription factor [Oerskovia flava]|uniref:ArsR/SmtB family transcription factor n=1 Tax=Oerskovia flava TaxID=2986422 RepID=UPI00223E9CA2|nr:winged helix-turn-helix domain-containing protein [Oerskovia sp. JB1-3-2]
MDELTQRLSVLEERVARLEQEARDTAAHDAADPSPASPHPPPDDTFWALEGLQARTGRPDGTGAVMIVGDVTLPGGQGARWQYGLGTDDVLALAWDDAADVFAALGHPVRLALLRAVADAPRAARELAEEVGAGSTGQVYHHLKQLQAAGWLRTRPGGVFVIPPERLVPLLTTILGGLR